eukprot:Sspe_Gene.34413::Locus_16733_Transcript_1_1_Confidence_1.000_Length_2554::g.34413::m.34413/K01638/aceB, glcB; malate synthase
MAQIQKELGPRNAELLQTRRDLQDKIDEFYKSRGDMRAVDDEERLRFLQEINYILPPASQFSVSTQNVDEEIANIPAPQLVCPIDNDRFIVNAGNARWGSLLDAFYGTDAIPPPRAKSGAKYDEQRGARVFAEVHRLLDKIFPLTVGSWGTVSNVEAEPGKLEMTIGGSGPKSQLRHPEKFVGYRIEGDGTTSSVLLKNNGLHVELQIDRTHPIGVYHAAGIKDVILESALTAIADAEDSACTVDAEDKVRAYKNWRGLMKGTISVPMKNFVRKQNPDLTWTRSDGKDTITLPGRVVLMCRNVGLHMYTDIVKFEGKETPEHFLDAMVTALCGLHNLGAKLKNSRTGSLYIVKPKMHGPDEGAPCRRPLLHGGGRAGAPPQHHQDGDHGRGASPIDQPAAVDVRGEGAYCFHQHWVPGPDRRRDLHGDEGRAGPPEGADQERAVAPGLRAQQRAGRAGHPADREGADREGDVGRPRQHGRDAEEEEGPPAAGGDHFVGSLPDSCHHPTPCTTMRST